MTAIHALADKHGLFVLEDCAHAVETQLGGQPVGVARGKSRFAAYSFYATKNLVTGEGGMLTCRDADDLAQASVLGLHGMSADAWKRYAGAEAGASAFKLYDIVAAGYKYNMYDMQAALGLVQLGKLEANWQRRQARVRQYQRQLAGDGRIELLEYERDGARCGYHLYAIRLAPGLADKRDEVIRRLRQRNVEAYVHFICLTGTQFYRESYGTALDDTPVAAGLSARSITLPLFPGMAEADVDYACAQLKAVLDEI
jgi:dTDP-4-amino-4,6-dideoxygalactose transaminase